MVFWLTFNLEKVNWYMKKIILMLALMFITPSCTYLERSEQFKFGVPPISESHTPFITVNSIPGYFVNLFLFPVAYIDYIAFTRFLYISKASTDRECNKALAFVIFPMDIAMYPFFTLMGFSTYKFVSEL